MKWSYWPKFIFRETPQAEFYFLESQTSKIELIKSVDPKLKINEHLGVLPTGIPTEWIASSEMLKV